MEVWERAQNTVTDTPNSDSKGRSKDYLGTALLLQIRKSGRLQSKPRPCERILVRLR